MTEQERYDLVFKGELAKGAELAVTKQNIGKLFKIAPDKVDALFTGRAITLKKQLDFDAATRYRAAIKKAGARVDLIACQSEMAPSIAEQASSEVPAQTAGDDSHVAAGAPVSSDRAEAEAGLSLRAMEGNLIDNNELDKPQPVKVDISGLSLAQAGEDILRPEERAKTVTAEFNTQQFSLVNEPKPN